MPRPKEIEKKVSVEDEQLLAQVEGVALSPEEQEAIEGMKAHFDQYGELTSSERKTLKRLARQSE